jgi:hypothetical protein
MTEIAKLAAVTPKSRPTDEVTELTSKFRVQLSCKLFGLSKSQARPNRCAWAWPGLGLARTRPSLASPDPTVLPELGVVQGIVSNYGAPEVAFPVLMRPRAALAQNLIVVRSCTQL